MGKTKKIILGVSVGAVIAVAAGAWYVNDYYHAVDVEEMLVSSEEVRVKQVDTGWFFDGAGEERALIFYPGAKVQTEAYAPLMYELAEQGVDCFLVDMPFRLAIFGLNRADTIMGAYDYSEWYLAGHSLGGAMAASYAKNHLSELDGLIFLAAYSTVDLSEATFPVLSIYGSEDGVLNLEKVEEGRALMPAQYDEKIIEGGNHAGFGSYGAQDGDGTALLTAQEQWEVTVSFILEEMERD